ncbi:ATP-binding protein [Hydrogenophaga sp. 5NK40-0174]|uniref:sensor histidine kinase n=1 Tax=Hydrogenophaga sp. 5NK40-0174 TaxID=3127649 RepID=UPI00333FBF75
MDNFLQVQLHLYRRVFAALFNTSPQQSPLAPRLVLGLVTTAAAALATALFPDQWEGGRFATYSVATIISALLGGWQAGVFSMFLSLVFIDLALTNWQPGLAFFSWQQALLLNASHFIAMGLAVVSTALLQSRNHRLRESISQAEFEHQHFIDTFEHAAIGIAHVSPAGNILLANKMLCDMLGLIRAEIISTSVEEHLEDKLSPALLPRLHALAAGEHQQAQIECKLRPKGGRTEWVLLTFAIVRHPHTRSRTAVHAGASYFIAVFQDITPRKLVETELRRLHSSLERRIKTRTRELSTAYDELERYSYAVAHDLRSPLRIINGFAQSIEEDEKTLSEAGHYHLQRIKDASRNMGQLIDGLLRLAQYARGGIRRTPVDVSSMATKLLQDYSSASPERLVQWQVEPGMSAQADEALMHAVLSNLLGNAWKYTAQTPSPRITVSSTQEGPDTWFHVADNGAGFDMDKASNLFRPFQRLHTAKEFPGLGIGLATVRRIVERHDGHIRARGQRGEGANFAFTMGHAFADSGQ